MAGKRLADMDIGGKFVSDKVRLVTPTELDMFCNITGMRGDAFLSDEVAKSYGMKSRLLPGAMSFAILFSLLEEVLQGAIFTGSTVGVIKAATTAIITTANLQYWISNWWVTNPRLARMNITTGNSNATPIQNIIPVTNFI